MQLAAAVFAKGGKARRQRGIGEKRIQIGKVGQPHRGHP